MDLSRARTCIVIHAFKTLTGFYAKKGARGYITSDNRGFYNVLFTKDSLPLIKSNNVRGNMLEVPYYNLKIEPVRFKKEN